MIIIALGLAIGLINYNGLVLRYRLRLVLRYVTLRYRFTACNWFSSKYRALLQRSCVIRLRKTYFATIDVCQGFSEGKFEGAAMA
jgi:hypothetical protein